jgi:hypothetical protein
MLATRRRKRRFPERELLDRLCKYEDLLRQNNIPFEALGQCSTGEGESTNADASGASDENQSEENGSESNYQARHALNVGSHPCLQH